MRERVRRNGRRAPRLAVLVLAACAAGAFGGGETRAADRCADALITAAVKSRLAADDLVGAFKINVDTDGCVVTLRGCVATRAQARRARALAAKGPKVRGVKSRLTLCPDGKK